MIIKEYSKGETTVVWKPEICIHSEKCFHGLPKVFNPNQRPWVDMDGADEETIRNQVAKCPSGALSIKNSEEELRSTTTIEVAVNGPLLVKGIVKIKTASGEVHRSSKSTALCRCGASSNKPFCDGTHKKIGFKG